MQYTPLTEKVLDLDLDLGSFISLHLLYLKKRNYSFINFAHFIIYDHACLIQNSDLNFNLLALNVRFSQSYFCKWSTI